MRVKEFLKIVDILWSYEVVKLADLLFSWTTGYNVNVWVGHEQMKLFVEIFFSNVVMFRRICNAVSWSKLVEYNFGDYLLQDVHDVL